MEEKIALLNLSEAESAKLPKFMASLAFVTADEIKETQMFLATMDIIITTAHQASVLTNPLEELKRKISILEEVHVSDMYKQNPLMLNKNAIEIYKKVNYCIQNNVSYKKDDGTYESFLFTESEFQKKFNKESEVVTRIEVNQNLESNDLEQTLVTLDPLVEPTDPEPVSVESQSVEVEETEIEKDVFSFGPQASDIYPDSVDIKEFMAQDAKVEEAPTMNFASLEDSVSKMHSEIHGDMEDFEPKTEGLTEAKKDILNFKKTQLNNYKSSFASSLEDEFVGFGDIEPETYGMGRAA